MLDTAFLNQLLDIKESYQAPNALMRKIEDPYSLKKICDQILTQKPDLSKDFLRDYYQLEHSNRKNLGQDYTPNMVAKLATMLLPAKEHCLDMCAGTGSLTIARWGENPNCFYICEEYSTRAIPFLILNCVLRNMNAIIRQGDSLTRSFDKTWQLTKGENYSTITPVNPETIPVQAAISNPPYSLKWEQTPHPAYDKYAAYPPASRADYAFLTQILHQLTPDGTASVILPHGVLFRGSAEAKIRKQLIENSNIHAIISLPEKLFLHTDIPTIIMILKKTPSKDGIFFIDASKEFDKGKKRNFLLETHVSKILETVTNRQDVPRYAHLAPIEEIRGNDYNLNIPRYVDTFIPEPVPAFEDLAQEIIEIDQEILSTATHLATMMNNLACSTVAEQQILDGFRKMFIRHYGLKPAKKKQTQGGLF